MLFRDRDVHILMLIHNKNSRDLIKNLKNEDFCVAELFSAFLSNPLDLCTCQLFSNKSQTFMQPTLTTSLNAQVQDLKIYFTDLHKPFKLQPLF